MTTEESLYDNLLDTCQLLELHNLTEFMSANTYAWWQLQKLQDGTGFSPAEIMILNAADTLKKKN